MISKSHNKFQNFTLIENAYQLSCCSLQFLGGAIGDLVEDSNEVKAEEQAADDQNEPDADQEAVGDEDDEVEDIATEAKETTSPSRGGTARGGRGGRARRSRGRRGA